jgi:hypothetical protein
MITDEANAACAATARSLSTEASVFISVDPWLTIFRFHISSVSTDEKVAGAKAPATFVFYINAARNPYGVTVL